MDETLFDPVAQYANLANAIKANSESYFEELVKLAQVDKDANRKTVLSWKKLLATIAKKNKHRNSLRAWRVFFYIFAGLCFLLSVMFLIFVFVLPDLSWWISIFLLVLFALAGAAFIVMAVKILTPKIRNFLSEIQNLQAQADALYQEAVEQMAPLNERYDWNSHVAIVKKTVPILSMDNFFDPKKQDIFLHRFHYEENNQDFSSVYFVQSGTIRDNPFIIERDNMTSMIDQTYSASITIHWTTTYKDKEGNSHQENHEQTLSASLVRPAPIYYTNTYLFYGNDSCPNLAFLRKATHLNNPTAPELSKFIRGRKKDLKEKAKTSLLKDSKAAFTTLGDEDFDALFGADNRNNEVEFRVLFTPLAEKGMTNLITKSPFGDDFAFSKSGVLNMVRSEHLETADLYANPAKFVNYDVDAAKIIFVNYQCDYFKNLYYAMAPILAIPEYEINKPIGYEYHEEKTNLTDTEEEVMANTFDFGTFNPPGTERGTLLKSEFIKKQGPFDLTEITAHSYGANHLVQSFNRNGGDGKVHVVNVPYLEYFPLTRKVNLCLINLGISRYDYNKKFLPSGAGKWILSKRDSSYPLSFQRGILAFVPTHEFSETEIKEYVSLSSSNTK